MLPSILEGKLTLNGRCTNSVFKAGSEDEGSVQCCGCGRSASGGRAVAW